MADGRFAVLIVEDDVLIRFALADAFNDRGWDVTEASNALEAIPALGGSHQFDVLVSDVDMPRPLNGLHLVTMVARLFPRMSVAVSSGRHEIEAPLSARSRSSPSLRRPTR
jgi:DNA-binding NtrC family response regulator